MGDCLIGDKMSGEGGRIGESGLNIARSRLAEGDSVSCLGVCISVIDALFLLPNFARIGRLNLVIVIGDLSLTGLFSSSSWIGLSTVGATISLLSRTNVGLSSPSPRPSATIDSGSTFSFNRRISVSSCIDFSPNVTFSASKREISSSRVRI